MHDDDLIDAYEPEGEGRRKSRLRGYDRVGFLQDTAADTVARTVEDVPEELGKVPELIRGDLLTDAFMRTRAATSEEPPAAAPASFDEDDELALPPRHASALRDFIATYEEDEEDEDDDAEDEPELVLPSSEPAQVIRTQPDPEPLSVIRDSDVPVKLKKLMSWRGLFASHTALSLISPNLTQDVDELNNAFSSFGNLEKGQHGFISVTFRRCHEFEAESNAQIALIKGDDTQMVRSRGERFRDAMHYFFARGFWEMAKSGSEPIAPWHRGRHVQQASPKDDKGRQTLRDAENKARAKAHFETRLHVGIMGNDDDAEQMDAILADVRSAFENYSTSHQALDWVPADPWEAVTGYMPVATERLFILSNEELGEIARVPDRLTKPNRITVSRSRLKPVLPEIIMECKDPLNPPKGMIPFGVLGPGTENERNVGMRINEMDKHMFIAGATGTGKSVLMERLVFGCVKSGYPVVVMDPHGTFVDHVRDSIMMYAPERLNDIVFIDCAEEEHPVAFNPLDVRDEMGLRLAIGSVLEMLAQELGLTSANLPRAINYATHAVTALAEANLLLSNPNVKCTLLNVPDFFQDAEFRQLVLGLCSNPTIRDVYDPQKGSFEMLNDKTKNDHVMPVLSRFYPLGNSPAFSNVFAAPENKLDFSRLITGKKIILMKLGRFDTAKELSSFMGNLVIPYMLKSMHQWGRKEDEDTGDIIGEGVRLFVDEAHAIIGNEGSSAVTVLAEARKYDLGLVAATQFPEQLDRGVMKAFFGNTKSKICLALDETVVGDLYKGVDGGRGKVTKSDIIALPNYHGYCNVLIADGEFVEQSGPFAVRFLGPLKVDRRSPEYREKLAQVKRQSRLAVCNTQEYMRKKRSEGLNELKTALLIAAQNESEAMGGGGTGAGSSTSLIDIQSVIDENMEQMLSVANAPDNDDEEFPWS